MGSNPPNERDRDAQGRWLQEIKALLADLAGSDVVELELTRGDGRVRLVREVGPVQPVAPAFAGPAPALEAAVPAASGTAIRTPITGVFYLTPAPGAPPFVSVGDRVEPGQVVGLVEAMKVFNEIAAEAAGTVVEILVESGNVVEKGQPLLVVLED